VRRRRDLRSFFFRCDACGGEFAHTIDLMREDREPAATPCHCGGTYQPAPLPQLVMPDPGGDGNIYEVMPLGG
jgi:hypothetical protein